jgi:hypothetical protein
MKSVVFSYRERHRVHLFNPSPDEFSLVEVADQPSIDLVKEHFQCFAQVHRTAPVSIPAAIRSCGATSTFISYTSADAVIYLNQVLYERISLVMELELRVTIGRRGVCSELSYEPVDYVFRSIVAITNLKGCTMKVKCCNISSTNVVIDVGSWA